MLCLNKCQDREQSTEIKCRGKLILTQYKISNDIKLHKCGMKASHSHNQSVSGLVST